MKKNGTKYYWASLFIFILMIFGYLINQYFMIRSLDFWSDSEKQVMRSLALSGLNDRPEDPSNAFFYDPAAVKLGKQLFYDPVLSRTKKISCSTCHQPEHQFTDGLSVGHGLASLKRNTPSLLGVSYQIWFAWDGRSDSLWSQALQPLESLAEMGITRTEVVSVIFRTAYYRDQYIKLFGSLDEVDELGLLAIPASPRGDNKAQENWSHLSPSLQLSINRVFTNLGKSLAAYERTLMPLPSRFDRYVQSLDTIPTIFRVFNNPLSSQEIKGLRLFLNVSKTQCLNCHNGSLFTNNGFHDIGTNLTSHATTELGRMLGRYTAEHDEFNCLSRYSDALPNQCKALRFSSAALSGDGRGAFKVPTLRNLSFTAPYMHDGQFKTLHEVLTHYNHPPLSNIKGVHELKPLSLSFDELESLESFLKALDSLN